MSYVMYSVQYTVYSIQYTVYSIQYTVYMTHRVYIVICPLPVPCNLLITCATRSTCPAHCVHTVCAWDMIARYCEQVVQPGELQIYHLELAT